MFKTIIFWAQICLWGIINAVEIYEPFRIKKLMLLREQNFKFSSKNRIMLGKVPSKLSRLSCLWLHAQIIWRRIQWKQTAGNFTRHDVIFTGKHKIVINLDRRSLKTRINRGFPVETMKGEDSILLFTPVSLLRGVKKLRDNPILPYKDSKYKSQT